MSKFSFKFEPVKKVKEAFEKQTQKDIAVIDLEINRTSEEIISISEQKNNTIIKNGTSLSAAELSFNKSYRDELDRKIEEKNKAVNKLEEEKDKKQEELLFRAKERKIFSALKEIYLENYIIGENKKEMTILNEIAVQKHARNRNEE